MAKKKGGTYVSTLSIKKGGVGKKTYRLHKKRMTIGSVESADIRIPSKGVAPIHAVLEQTGDPKDGASSVTIYDLSESGVKINGKKEVNAVLQVGDDLEVAGVLLSFSVEKLKDAPKERMIPDIIRDSGGRTLVFDPNEDLSPLLLGDFGSEEDYEDIFDHSESNKQALEVIMSWKGTILDVEHFNWGKTVTIGARRSSDFGVPESVTKSKLPLVESSRGGCLLNLTNEMRGVVQQNGQIYSIEELRRTSPKKKDRYQVPFGESDFAKIEFGEIDFYLNQTASPPTLKRRRLFAKDPLCSKIIAGSIAFTIALVMAILSVELPETLEAEELPERIATILYQPEKYYPKVQPEDPDEGEKAEPEKSSKSFAKPKPPKVTKLDLTQPRKERSKRFGIKGTKRKGLRSARVGKEGAGKRAKGSEGRRGSRSSKIKGRPTKKARGAGGSQVEDYGNLDALKGAGQRIQDLLGGASKKGARNKNLIGFGGFDTQGTGKALSGKGVGGGGRSSTIAGLSNSGRGQGRIGTGLGAAGSGKGIVGGRSRIELRTGGAEETVVMGAIDADAVEAAILRHKDEFRLCYEREINAGNPKLAGRVGTSFVIGSRGRVTRAGIAQSSLRNRNTERCIVKILKRIQFPRPRGGGIVQVKYAFKFRQVGRSL